MLKPKQTIVVGETRPEASSVEDGSLFIDLASPGNSVYQASQAAGTWNQVEGLQIILVDRGDSMFAELEEESEE